MWDNVGEEILVDHEGFHQEKNRRLETIIMVIKAPRGTLALFRTSNQSSPFTARYEDSKLEGIRAFMEQHSNG